MITALSFAVLLFIAVPIAVLALLGLILAIIRSTRVAGVTILTVLAVVLVGGATLLFYVQVGHVTSVRAVHQARMARDQGSSHETIILQDRMTSPVDIESTAPVAIDMEDAAATVSADAGDTVALHDSSVPVQPDVAEFEEFPAESDWVSSGAGVGQPTQTHPVGVMLPNRPSWVGEPPYVENQVDFVPVNSGPWVTRGECRRALQEAMAAAVNEYVADHHGDETAVQFVGIDLDYIETHLQAEPVYEEMVKYESIEHPMRQQHTLLKFGQEFRDEIQRRWNQVVVTSRLAHVALVLVAVLVGLGTIFTYFRLDTATKGYYSGRLQFATGTVILGLVALGILVARWVPWL